MRKPLNPIPNPFTWDGLYEPQSAELSCCTHCGKPILNPEKSAWVHVIDGGENLAPATWADEDSRIDSAGNMNWFQVGSTCKRKVPAAYRQAN